MTPSEAINIEKRITQLQEKGELPHRRTRRYDQQKIDYQHKVISWLNDEMAKDKKLNGDENTEAYLNAIEDATATIVYWQGELAWEFTGYSE